MNHSLRDRARGSIRVPGVDRRLDRHARPEFAGERIAGIKADLHLLTLSPGPFPVLTTYSVP